MLVQKTRNVLQNLQKQKSPIFFKLIPEKTFHMLQEMLITFPVLKSDTTSSKTFSPSSILEWNKLDPTLRNSKSFADFKNSILKFIRPFPGNAFDCNNYKGIRLIKWLHKGMNRLHEHKFKHNFQDCLNQICSCGLDIESTSHFLLHCPILNDDCYTLLRTLNNTDSKLLELTKSSLLQTLLYGNTLFDKEKTNASLMQQLHIFYLLKDLRSLLFGKFLSESLNPSRSFATCFILFTSYAYSLLNFFHFYLFPGILEFWCLETVTFKFIVLHNNIYRKKKGKKE